MFLLWILLPPIFLACGFLTLIGPYLVRKTEEAEEQFIPDRAALVDKHP